FSGNANVVSIQESTAGAGNDIYIDDFIIRKYTPNEPTFGTWGSQEQQAILSINVIAEATGDAIVPSTITTGTGITLSINVLPEAMADGIAPADIIEGQGITLTIDALAEALAEGIIPSNITAGTGVTLSVDVLAEAAAAGIPCIFAGYWDLPHKLKLTASNNRTLVLKASNNRDLVLKAENNRTLVLKARD
ncbi:MAG: hypothetical protein WC372_12035, partial [Candidatus Neomarinimicrobiota bacterium]